jgi:hypothetical protein
MMCHCGEEDCRHVLETLCEACFKARGGGELKTIRIFHYTALCVDCKQPMKNQGNVIKYALFYPEDVAP